MQRLRAGYCRAADPYGGPYGDAPDAVDGFLLRVAPFVVQFTLTGYPRSLETFRY